MPDAVGSIFRNGDARVVAIGVGFALAGEALHRSARSDDRAGDAADPGEVVDCLNCQDSLFTVMDLRGIERDGDQLRRLRIGSAIFLGVGSSASPIARATARALSLLRLTAARGARRLRLRGSTGDGIDDRRHDAREQ